MGGRRLDMELGGPYWHPCFQSICKGHQRWMKERSPYFILKRDPSSSTPSSTKTQCSRLKKIKCPPPPTKSSPAPPFHPGGIWRNKGRRQRSWRRPFCLMKEGRENKIKTSPLVCFDTFAKAGFASQTFGPQHRLASLKQPNWNGCLIRGFKWVVWIQAEKTGVRGWRRWREEERHSWGLKLSWFIQQVKLKWSHLPSPITAPEREGAGHPTTDLWGRSVPQKPSDSNLSFLVAKIWRTATHTGKHQNPLWAGNQAETHRQSPPRPLGRGSGLFSQ